MISRRLYFFGLCAGVLATWLTATTLVRAQGVTPDTVATVLQHGGTAALLAFMFWLLMDERKKNRTYEEERVRLIKETLEATNKMTAAVADSSRVLERVALSGTDVGKALERLAVLVEQRAERG